MSAITTQPSVLISFPKGIVTCTPHCLRHRSIELEYYDISSLKCKDFSNQVASLVRRVIVVVKFLGLQDCTEEPCSWYDWELVAAMHSPLVS